jgi:ABC-type proline/glycine betaine transport system permease subunit
MSLIATRDVLGADTIPRIEIGKVFAAIVDWINDPLPWLSGFIKALLKGANDSLAGGLNAIPPLVMVVILTGLAWWLRSWQFAVFTVIGMLVIVGMRYKGDSLWTLAMDTFALVIVAAVIAMLLAVPLGILAARNEVASKAIRPVMDFMQTMPAFVYLIPALFFFSIGTPAGLIATIVFAMPPGVRLTELGIRQVDPEMVEAGKAFGTKPGSILARIQLPLAMPTIMAGVNQVIMLSLSMVVIGSMVGAGGLGVPVLEGLTRLKVGIGFEGGLAVVILAIYLDRLTAALGDRSAVAKAARATVKAR